MKVSVALATYNGATHLKTQLESLADQTHPPHELVVADDGSKDATLRVLETFEDEAPFPVRVVAQDGGQGPTRNFERAMHACDGDVVMCCDQDDRWHSSKIERILAVFSSTTTVAFCDANLVDPQLAPLGTTLWKRLGFTPSHFDATQHLAKQTIAFGLTMAYRNDDWIRDLLFPIPMPFGHDNFTALVCAAVGDVALVPNPLLDYRQHANQVSGTQGKKSAVQIAITPTAESFEQLVDRVPPEALTAEGQRLMQFCAAKATHMRQRDALANQPYRQRIPGIADLVRCGDYARFSNGWKSAVRDVIGDRG